jgi:hypothetical protein
MGSASISYKTMSKKKTNLADKILEYIRRNESEQDIPAGYKSIKDWLVVLGCTRRTWGIMLPGLMRSKMAKVAKIRRVLKGKLRIMNYYQIDESFLRKVQSK